jgi:hypothetical protein
LVRSEVLPTPELILAKLVEMGVNIVAGVGLGPHGMTFLTRFMAVKTGLQA